METYNGLHGEVGILTRDEQDMGWDFAPTAAQRAAAEVLRGSGDPIVEAFEAQVHAATVDLPGLTTHALMQAVGCRH
ncbi:MAG TPA: hypothetical protein VGO07_02400 [Candidatus Saccharimonadales bacterium]|jgi:hypothetical protein|nr:hypothetical protein [Candidatus Saccharimonadales bacterium]